MRKVVIKVNEKNEMMILSQEGLVGLSLEEKINGLFRVRNCYFNRLAV